MKNLLLILIFLASCTAQKTEPILNENADLQTKLFYIEKNFKGKIFSDLEKDLSKQNIQVENIGMGSVIAKSNKMTYLTFTFLNKKKDTKMNLNKDTIDVLKINLQNYLPNAIFQEIISQKAIFSSSISNTIANSRIKSIEYNQEIHQNRQGEMPTLKNIKPKKKAK